MDVFRSDGHLTDESLEALAQSAPLEELTRLEMAEHLAFCDLCLQRYTDRLERAPLLTPERSCRETLWGRVRARMAQLFVNRYATAAAAVVLALTLLWGGGGLSDRIAQDQMAWFHRANDAVTEWASGWPQALEETFGRLDGFFDSFGAWGAGIQGGMNP